MLLLQEKYPQVIKFYEMISTGLIEFITAVIGLIIILIPTWSWGVSYIKKQKQKKKDIDDERKLLVNTISEINDTVKVMNKKITVFIAKDSAELKLSNVPTFICDEIGRYTDANPALCEIFGVNRDQMLGYGWLGYISDDDKERVVKNWENAIKNNIDIFDHYTINKGGSPDSKVKVTYRAILNRDEQGNIIQILGNVHLQQ